MTPPKERALVIALLASFALWNLPFGGVVLYPFKLFATWLHESAHALSMVLVGAGFEDLAIYQDTSGLARASHPVGAVGRAIIASAGYIGTALVGAGLLIAGQTTRGARLALGALTVLLAASAVFFISNSFGAAAAGIGALVCAGVAVFPKAFVPEYTVCFLAAQSCANAVLDIRVLYRTELVINGQLSGTSDAHNMAKATFGSPSLWASVWLGVSLVALYAALRAVSPDTSETASEIP